ncbi:CamS family sex pheromone protein [Lactobacillus mulieris]|uniref:CamS family sex pheromone protein n=1 Tax=Lactobacillus mulieris TaxID=2508708 RepID=A0AAP3GXG5_9LACO|nr:CamS family sex pheromone protein [Lactobacillus mulieris]MCZ3845259.1 CamS family sex pheromone protein [Lactobacillus mulieris]MCZ3877037.1 CamS family sex pheromone protein [Lactobacillus mulieris]MCZ3900500.1 CamS family sex pheromone protein [Lactobacillus mulieris]
MKKFLQIALLASSMLVLAGCGRLGDSDLANNATTTNNKTKKYQTTSTNSGYTVLLKNGKYVTSSTSGLTSSDLDNTVDSEALERGLVNLDKNVFSTNKYVFQEGQKLSSSTISSWLMRESKSYPDGLNPKNNGKTTRNPVILNQILEQDFLTGSGSNYKLSGISLGLALNSIDYYQKTTGGPQYSSNISRSKQEEYGKETADKIVARLRKKKEMKNIPIMISLFSKTSQDSLVGGTFFAYGVAEGNSSKITNWKSVSEKSQVLPTVNNESPVNSDDASAFNSFKSAIEDYFPNLSGVVATVRYQNDKLTQENIQITTQFYGYVQIQSFTRLVQSEAKKYLAKDVPIEIKISSVNDVQAIVYKNSGDDSYSSHIYGGE